MDREARSARASPENASALLVSHDAMQIAESMRPLSNEVCIELTTSAGGIGMGPAAYGRIAKRKPSNSVARSADNMVEPPSHTGASPVHGTLFGMYPLRGLVADGGYQGPEFGKPITKILPSSKLKSSSAPISPSDRRQWLRARSTVFRRRPSVGYSAS